jgi:uncharacterized membrane protein
MARVEGKLRVDVPVDVAYRLWSRPQEFTNFLGGVTEVKSQGRGSYKITTEHSGRKDTWTVRMHKEAPRTVRWRAVDGGQFLGEVVLRTTSGGSEITLIVDYEPHTDADNRPMVLPMWDVGGDLLRFRLYAEGVYEDQLENQPAGATS